MKWPWYLKPLFMDDMYPHIARSQGINSRGIDQAIPRNIPVSATEWLLIACDYRNGDRGKTIKLRYLQYSRQW